ncbi:ATP-binding protein [Amycolatopsis sp. NPDC059021]|uniref:ATP-binding protein n=1 Tax=Amycolatopsis sp. NPDC059021 TaxID=3346704 RepID=UPI00366F15B2
MVETGTGGAAFSRELARLLARRRMSWRQLADQVGYTRSWLSKVKNGAVPSPELARRCDEVLEASGDLVALVEAGSRRPAQLPAVTACFTGRTAERHRLIELLREPGQAGAPRVVSIDGLPGAGKTTLALRWAHENLELFPDGQLYVDLRGYSPARTPLSAGEALEEFLLALGVPGEEIPASPTRRAGLYRSLLVGRRVLVVLDNAAGVEQIHPLIPGSPGCAVLVTSRSQLPGLGVSTGARRLTLGPLSADESFALLRGVIGDDHTRGEPEAVRRLARQCAHLPLALRIAAERVVTGLDRDVVSVAAHLAADGLDSLSLGEATAVRAVFSWSYRGLSAELARLFRLLSLHPGRRISAAAAAALAGISAKRARNLAEQLVNAHLLEPHDRDGYSMHDLIRLYASERADVEDSPEEQAAARRGLVEWYLRSTLNAAGEIAPYRAHVRALSLPELPVEGQAFDDSAAAVRWCESEVHNFAPITRLAADHGMEDLAWRLPLALFDYFMLRKPWSAWLAGLETALRAARAAGDRRGLGWLHTDYAVAQFWLRDLDRSRELFTEALRIGTEVADQHGQAWALCGLARVACERTDAELAEHHAQRAGELLGRLGECDGQAAALAVLAEAQCRDGRRETALATATRALELCEQVRNHYGRGRKLAKIAELYHAQGEHQRALRYLELSSQVRCSVGDRWGEADVHLRRGDILHELGRAAPARDEWQAAFELYGELEDPRVADACSRLTTFPGTAGQEAGS